MDAREAQALRNIRERELSEFPVGTTVTSRYLSGSVGQVIEVQPSDSLLLGPRFRVRWRQHAFLPPGEMEDSGWLSWSELERHPGAEE